MGNHARIKALGLVIPLLMGACGQGARTSSHELAVRSGTAYNCQPIPACDATSPDPGALRPFSVKKPDGNPWHRGHDLYVREGETQWVIGKFHYGNLLLRKNLQGEEVDIYLLRGCGESWEKLGTTRTSAKGSHEAVEGIADDGGRVYFAIPADKALGVGRHRLRLVVAGDHTATDLFIEVLPSDVPLFVSDVDGTLTTSELADVSGTLFKKTPDANDGAASALDALVEKGFRPVYLTARAEAAVQRTRDFVQERFMPAGKIETSLAGGPVGLTGAQAVSYKTEALARLIRKGFQIALAFGNTDTDAQAYENAGIPQDSRYFFKYDDKKFGGNRIESYRDFNGFSDRDGVCH